MTKRCANDATDVNNTRAWETEKDVLERNSISGMAIALVAEIWDRRTRTDGSCRIITSCISSMHTLNACTQMRAHFETTPNSRQLMTSRWKRGPGGNLQVKMHMSDDTDFKSNKRHWSVNRYGQGKDLFIINNVLGRIF